MLGCTFAFDEAVIAYVLGKCISGDDLTMSLDRSSDFLGIGLRDVRCIIIHALLFWLIEFGGRPYCQDSIDSRAARQCRRSVAIINTVEAPRTGRCWGSDVTEDSGKEP